MLILLFKIGNERYGLDVNQIVEVIPLVLLKKIPRTPAHVAGLMNYRGKPVPVIDLGALLESGKHENKFSTRIIIIDYPVSARKRGKLGLIAGEVLETLTIQQQSPDKSGVLLDESLSLAKNEFNTEEIIQWFDIERILPEHEVKTLFQT